MRAALQPGLVRHVLDRRDLPANVVRGTANRNWTADVQEGDAIRRLRFAGMEGDDQSTEDQLRFAGHGRRQGLGFGNQIGV